VAGGVYTIGSAARLLRVPVATIRTWEKRYGLVVPARSNGGQRLYTREQLDQLRFVVARISEGMRPGEAYRLLQQGSALSLDVTLPATTRAPEAARRALDDFAVDLGDEQHFNLRLLVSELVANAVRHAKGDDEATLRLTARVGGDRVHVEVSDQGGGFDWKARPRSNGGRGLPLVAAVADRWGLTFENGTTAWFELRRPQPAIG
jgi:DNA-binding transcriptional MerR regulator